MSNSLGTMTNKLSWRRLVVATIAAPLFALIFYGAVCVIELGHFPRTDEAWLYSAVAGATIVAYLVTSLVTTFISFSCHRFRPRSFLLFGIAGFMLGILVAIFLDLPNVNFARLEYYGLAAAAGAGTGLAYRAILYGLTQSDEKRDRI